MRTATSSHSSPEVEVSVGEVGVPPNHQTIGREVEVGGERRGDCRRRERCCDRSDDGDDGEVGGAEDEEKAETEGVWLLEERRSTAMGMDDVANANEEEEDFPVMMPDNLSVREEAEV